MCGIAGFVGKGSRDDLTQMMKEIRHRGPDAEGSFLRGSVGFAHTRLAVVDLTPSGAQPMWNAAGDIAIIFNGEIYDHQKIRSHLEQQGIRFKGTSDTEVILALYEKKGESCFAELNGMFAIAIYDFRKEVLILARDRMGKKPLYYGVWDGTLVFGSEPRSLLAHPRVSREIDPCALQHYLAHDYVPTPFAIWQGMKKIPPASYVKFDGALHEPRVYWDLFLTHNESLRDDHVATLDHMLEGAVARRLVADVPVGVFLSGGIDSSLVTYYAAKHASEKVKTFSMSFREKSFDESDHAEAVAAHIKTDHHTEIVTPEDMLRVVPEIFARLDEPMADASIVPTYLLAQFTRKHVTVALGGDGGDELFAGYPTFQAEKIYQYYSMLPDILKRGVIEPLIRSIPTSHANMSIDFKLKKFVEGAHALHRGERHLRWLGTFSDGVVGEKGRDRARPFLHCDPYQFGKEYVDRYRQHGEENALLAMYQRSYMMDQVLVKVDRASMYHALEVRAPYLDREVVEFSNALAYQEKISGMTTKAILKRVARGKLPDAIIDRPKKGFGIPIGTWLRGPLRDWGESLLRELDREDHDLIDKQVVKRLWSEHQAGTHDHRKKLWNILVFLAWKKNFL